MGRERVGMEVGVEVGLEGLDRVGTRIGLRGVGVCGGGDWVRSTSARRVLPPTGSE